MRLEICALFQQFFWHEREKWTHFDNLSAKKERGPWLLRLGGNDSKAENFLLLAKTTSKVLSDPIGQDFRKNGEAEIGEFLNTWVEGGWEVPAEKY